MRPSARVVLVDDCPLLREHLKALIQVEADLTVCGEAEDVPTAFSLIDRLKPDLVILDLSLKGSSGLELLEDLRELPTQPAVLVLSMHAENFYVVQALQAGARGYITKEDAAVNMLPAIRQVLSGGYYLSDRLAGPVRDKAASGAPPLSEAAHV